MYPRKKLILTGGFLGSVVVLALLAKPLRPVLLELYLIARLGAEDETTWRHAAEKLIELRRPRGIQRVVVTHLERDTENFLKWQEKLFRLDLDPSLTLPGYREALRHGSASVRKKAINALRHPLWRLSQVPPILIEALKCDDPGVRWSAAYILATFGTAAQDAIAELIDLLGDRQETVRWAAAVALTRMASASDEPIRPLIKALDDPSPFVASHAAIALSRFGRAARGSCACIAARHEDSE